VDITIYLLTGQFLPGEKNERLPLQLLCLEN